MKKKKSLACDGDPGILLARWTSYGVAFGCEHKNVLIKLGTIRSLRKKAAKVKEHIEKDCELPLPGGSSLRLINTKSLRMSLIPLEVSKRNLKKFWRLSRSKGEIVRTIAQACWEESEVLFRMLR